MARIYADRVQETSTTTGTGTYTLGGAVTGYQAFSAGVGDGNTCYYCAIDCDSNGNPIGGWEVGLGTYTLAGTTLARTSVLASSNGGSAVNWAAGTRRIFVDLPATDVTGTGTGSLVRATSPTISAPTLTAPVLGTPASGSLGSCTNFGELDYVEFTSNVTPNATTEGTANTIVTGNSVSYDGSTVVLIEFSAPQARADSAVANRSMTYCLYEDGVSIGFLGIQLSPAAVGANVPVRLERRMTPSNGNHTYSIRAFVSAGTGLVGAGTGGLGNAMPGFIRITKK